MVFTSPNPLSLFFQKQRFPVLFGHLLAPQMLTLGTRWRPKGTKSAPRGAPKARPDQRLPKRRENKPDLAREREARFIFGALADQLACILEKLKESVQDFLSSSPTPSSCTIVYCTILCCCAILCYTMLCYAMLCWAMLGYALLCSDLLCSAL